MASHAVSLVLVRVKNRVQRPIYYVSKLLHEAEIRYLPLEKAICFLEFHGIKLSHKNAQYTVRDFLVFVHPTQSASQKALNCKVEFLRKTIPDLEYL